LLTFEKLFFALIPAMQDRLNQGVIFQSVVFQGVIFQSVLFQT
jgi:hypothetical protein